MLEQELENLRPQKAKPTSLPNGERFDMLPVKLPCNNQHLKLSLNRRSKMAFHAIYNVKQTNPSLTR